jgi:isoamylase
MRAVDLDVSPGRPYPLGATYDGIGTNFSLFTEHGELVEVCLFDAQGRETRIRLPEETAHIHHGFIAGVGPGQRYGFRVHGPWRPASGQRFNAEKLLLDPYAKAVEGEVRWHRSLFSHQQADESRISRADSGPFMPKTVVVSPYFDWGNDHHPETPWYQTVVYEMHVKGFTARHPGVPPQLRGTYAGLATEPVIEHLVSLGVTAVELQPIHQFINDQALYERGLRQYWGYNSIGYLAPHNLYSASGSLGQQVQEFKALVKTLHAVGIEVWLDVVYNHTAEGNHLGPTLSYKGIDNEAYYRLDPSDKRFYIDYTGTGNTLNVRHPHVLQLMMDSLRYWVLEMHVDGFRFDLAAALARTLHDVDRLSAFFDIIQQDPVISQVKLIAEPWDVGEGGYQVGNFPPLWSEWNGRYRDTVRDFWRGQDQTLPELAARLTGSSDLYEHTGRKPWASINFVTCHDGFTLRDLVSYNEKHNEANGEENRDGESDNRSWNCGVEGATDDAEVVALRDRQVRNMLVTLFLSQGVPMLLAGDEIGRTQFGNNNAYCQDNAISWVDWEHADGELLAFVRSLARFRARHSAFRRRRWFQGRPLVGGGVTDIAWFSPDGREMSVSDWQVGFAKTVGVYLAGDGLPAERATGHRADPMADASYFVILNAFWEPLEFSLPDEHFGGSWLWVLDTAREHDPFFSGPDDHKPLEVNDAVHVSGRSVVVLQRLEPSDALVSDGASLPSPRDEAVFEMPDEPI